MGHFVFLFYQYIYLCFDIYIWTQIIFQHCSGGDDEDCGREDQVLGELRIQQTDEEEPRLVDGTVFLVNQERVVIFMKTISNGNNSKTDAAPGMFALAKLYWELIKTQGELLTFKPILSHLMAHAAEYPLTLCPESSVLIIVQNPVSFLFYPYYHWTPIKVKITPTQFNLHR